MSYKCSLYALLLSHIHATCPALLILLDLIIQIIFARIANDEASVDT
jgi:hypothetical protein